MAYVSPDQFVGEWIGKRIDIDGNGFWCVDAFRQWCNEVLGYNYPTPNNWADGYWYGRADHPEFIPVTSGYKNGDWLIWARDGQQPCPDSHISMYYNGRCFGMRQGTADHAFTITDIDYSKALGALRWKGYAGMNQGKHKGIDVSEFNDMGMDLTGIEFVIVRAAWGTHEDWKAEHWIRKLDAAGIPYGLYHYSYALDEAGARSEAKFFLDLIRQHGWKPKVGCWLDMEDADNYKQNNGVLNTDLCTMVCRIWCTAVESEGFYTGIYASQSWFGTYIDMSVCAPWDKWVASWGTNDGTVQRDTSNIGTMLQYTSRGGTNGAPLDRDLTYIDLSVYDISAAAEDPAVLREKIRELNEKIEWYLSTIGAADRLLESARKVLAGEEI